MSTEIIETSRAEQQYAIINKEYKNEYVTIDNAVVRAKEKTNLLESKIEILAVHHLDKHPLHREKSDNVGNKYQVSYVIVSSKEIKQLMGRTDGKSYEEIKRAAMGLKEKFILVENKQNHQFVMRSLYGDVAYNEGALYIEFNNDAQNIFLNLKEQYTKFPLPILFSFKKNGGFQLYKLLKSFAFSPNLPAIDMGLQQEELPMYKVSYGVNELRMTLGYVDLTQKKLKEEAGKKRPDFDKMIKEEKNPQYKRWSDFSARVIEPGVKEINALSDIYIAEVVKNTSGRGGKIDSIDFYIQHNKAYHEKNKQGILKRIETTSVPVLTEEEKNNIQDWLEDLLIDKGVSLRSKQLRTICETADYDKKKLQTALGILKNYSKDVSNTTGFLVNAIKENWQPDTSVKAKNLFKNFELDGNINVDELEKALLNKAASEN